jgi:methionyl aminopeptidase
MTMAVRALANLSLPSAGGNATPWSLPRAQNVERRAGRRLGRRADSALPTIALRCPEETKAIRQAGAAVRAALDAAALLCQPGVRTAELDAAAAAALRRAGAVSLFLHYPGHLAGHSPRFGFPASTCISVNEEVVHGIPGERELRDGDVVTIDCGAGLDAWCADAAATVCIGRVAPVLREMVDTAEEVLESAVATIRPGLRWSHVAFQMQAIAEDAGFGVVRQYVGHGIGRAMHEPPQVPAFVSDAFLRRGDFTLQAGMVLAIEPMLTLGSTETVVCDDGWTVVTADGLSACHVEHTVAVTDRGGVILTGRAGIGRESPAIPA